MELNVEVNIPPSGAGNKANDKHSQCSVPLWILHRSKQARASANNENNRNFVTIISASS